MISTISKASFRFSTNAVAAKTYAKFQEKYSAHLESFKKKSIGHERASEAVKRSTQKAYKHPFDDGHRRPYHSAVHTLQSFVDFVGPEQVSPHYENFGMARKDALTFWVGYFALTYIANTPDISFYAQSALPAWMFFFTWMYFWLEAKKALFMPILNRFYRKIYGMEMRNLEVYYAENIEVRVRNLMANARSQIDFKALHNDYLIVRNNTILNFLINEQISLKNHLHERAQNILKQAEALESMNQNKIINQVMSDTLNSVDKAYNDHKQQIEREMFKLALEGLANGKMDYAKDPILPYVVQTIQKTVDKFNAISPEDQRKLVTLTPEQIESIRLSDARIRDEFLQNEPKIDGTLKTHPNVSKILNKWGK